MARRDIPPPDGIRGQTPAWNCPACFSVLSVVHQEGPGRYACGPCEIHWSPDLFEAVMRPQPNVCPRCGDMTMGCDCCDPPTCRCECGWDVKG